MTPEEQKALLDTINSYKDYLVNVVWPDMQDKGISDMADHAASDARKLQEIIDEIENWNWFPIRKID